MTQLGRILTAEVERYLSAVDMFRANGHDPHYRPERIESLERPQMSRREIRAQTERVEK